MSYAYTRLDGGFGFGRSILHTGRAIRSDEDFKRLESVITDKINLTTPLEAVKSLTIINFQELQQ